MADDTCPHCGSGVELDADAEARSCPACGRWVGAPAHRPRAAPIHEARCPRCRAVYRCTLRMLVGRTWPRCLACNEPFEFIQLPTLRPETPDALPEDVT